MIVPEADRANSSTVQTVAAATVQQLLPSLGIPGSAVIEPTATRQVANVWHTSFRLSYNGIPVRDRKLSTTIGARTGTLMMVTSDLPATEPNAAEPTLDAARVASNVVSYLGADRTTPIESQSAPSLVYVPSHGSLKLCYELKVRQFGHAWRMTVDALNGILIEKKDMLEYVGGEKPESTIKGKLQASIHLHSPNDTLTTVGFDNAYVTINGKRVLPDSTGNWTYSGLSPLFVTTGFYGPWAHVLRHDDKTDTANFMLYPPYSFLWNDFYSHAAERDAFYHANFAREYAHRIDTGLAELDAQLTLNVNLDLACNAFYDADSIALNFFKSKGQCSNTGEIADVIYHEFGHRIAHIRYASGANGNLVNYTLGEGFADLASAFMRDDPRIGIGFYVADKNKVLRSCDNRKSFPNDINADSHITGEIISGAFWDLRKLIGHDTAERLFNAMEWLNPDAPDDTAPDILRQAFLETLLDVLLVDDDDNNLANGTPHANAILNAFAMHGISLVSLIHLAPQSLPDQDTLASGYPVALEADYHGPLGSIDPSSLLLHVSTDGHTFLASSFTLLHDSIYQATIPKVRPGTIVSYYASARLLNDSSLTVAWPPITEPLRFTVGFKREYSDDCEADRDWSLSVLNDLSTTGLWVRDVPIGTYNVACHYVQQDTDHTPNGTMCYVTGNTHDPNIDADDVDGGTTTLTTNAIDLSGMTAPALRYWYYYSNDQGNFAGEPVWETQISGDDGATWKDVQLTNLSTNGWTSSIVRVSDYVTPSANVRLRFIASDYVGAIVEAGIDDVEALSAPESTSSSVVTLGTGNPPVFGISSVRPNPALGSAPLTIDYSLPERTHATLVIKNVLGDQVALLDDRMMEAGTYEASCSSTPLAPGVYWAVLSTPEAHSIRRIVIQ